MRVERFEDTINELYGTFTVCGVTFYAADILRELDPTCYRIALYETEAYDDVEVD